MTDEDVVCVVTGAGRGLGRAIALHLAARGFRLGLCSRTDRELRATELEVRDRGARVHAERLDVADPRAVQSFAERVEEHLGPAHALINNAAVLGPVGRIDRVDLDAWREALTVNVVGVANTCAAFVPQMIELGSGSIVNLSGGGLGGPGMQSFMSAYSSAKGAVAVMTETVARELEPLGIRVNAIAPGAMPTAFMRPVLDAGVGVVGEELFASASSNFANASEPMDELTPEFEDLLDFLLSPDSAWLTGRLLSARWESSDQLRSGRSLSPTSSMFTLRRIDDALYTEINPA